MRNINNYQRIRTTESLDLAELKITKSDRPDQWIVQNEQFDRLNNALKQLPYEQREVITGNKKLYVSNYNLQAAFDLIKRKIKYEDHPDWFSGMSEEDAERIIKNFSHIQSIEQLETGFMQSISDKRHTFYVSSVTLSDDKHHAVAACVERRDNRVLRLTPQWTYFREGWWQTDD